MHHPSTILDIRSNLYWKENVRKSHLSSSMISVSRSNLYWKPEHPPPSMTTLRKDLSSSTISFSLDTHESLRRRSVGDWAVVVSVAGEAAWVEHQSLLVAS